ncbi:hypothetical protein EYF80_021268 [Liparis tanakae]|uniref:Uncharacterized protein n=1 Tax=Liparis tanakae TaxID=230148 RepID=A0A4Z2HU57_9TELE|nr:hypothetical protein EYF80_021268 [Liparis tanakae]
MGATETKKGSPRDHPDTCWRGRGFNFQIRIGWESSENMESFNSRTRRSGRKATQHTGAVCQASFVDASSHSSKKKAQHGHVQEQFMDLLQPGLQLHQFLVSAFDLVHCPAGRASAFGLQTLGQLGPSLATFVHHHVQLVICDFSPQYGGLPLDPLPARIPLHLLCLVVVAHGRLEGTGQCVVLSSGNATNSRVETFLCLQLAALPTQGLQADVQSPPVMMDAPGNQVRVLFEERETPHRGTKAFVIYRQTVHLELDEGLLYAFVGFLNVGLDGGQHGALLLHQQGDVQEDLMDATDTGLQVHQLLVAFLNLAQS